VYDQTARTPLPTFFNTTPRKPLGELDAEQEWRVQAIQISGNSVFSGSELKEALLTKERPWYTPWKERPVFDPTTFETDLERVQRLYEKRGYYQAQIDYDLQAEQEGLISIYFQVTANEPVTIAAVSVAVSAPQAAQAEYADTPPPPLPTELPVQTGEIFSEAAYHSGEQKLRDFFLARSHAHIQVQRQARLHLEHHTAHIEYQVEPGPVTVFGPTRVEGTHYSNPELVLRELSYLPGDPFSSEDVAESRENVLGLGLFRAAQFRADHSDGTPPVVPMRVQVEEQPPREIKLGLTYGTEDEVGVQAEWQHRNWFGDGRQLSLLLELSSVIRTVGVSFLQPHFLSSRTQGILNFRQEQQDEETFLLNTSRFRPRLEHRFSSTLSGFVGYRLELAKLSDVAPATIRALGGIKHDGVVSGPTLGLVWNRTEDPFDPHYGEVISFTLDQAGKLWDGDFRFIKLTVEAKKYQDVGWQTVLAGRLKIGLSEAFGARRNIPLFERFYAGGEKSVRGYGRRRLGPLSDSDDPLGGVSLIEGALELRRPLWRELGGAVFLDFGQVSLDTFDLPIDDLKFAAGVGVSYTTPLGPLRLDIGFPFDPPSGDQAWQIHFSIGQFF
jgi:outer membrane protein assembly complex protein YaeT